MYSRGGRRGNSRGRDLAGGWRRGDTGSGDGEGNGMPSINGLENGVQGLGICNASARSFLNEELSKQRIDNLERESEMKEERIRYLEREIQRLQQFERANTALEEKITIIEEKNTALEESNQELKEDKADLESRLEGSDSELDDVDPLALVGFRIRRRFLEKACRRASGWEHYEHDYVDYYVDSGNEAAHAPNFEADLALAKFLSGSFDNPRIQKMVRAVYGSESIPSNDVPLLIDSKTRDW